ncbi:MAG: hypothetical protein ABSF83_06695 [Nitrososphaerales archaeon]|jgi:hypothetical protein
MTSNSVDRSAPGPTPAQGRCYIHPDRRAVGTCVVCRRGVCRLCFVEFKGKNFCSPDAELLRKKEQPTRMMRFKKTAITAASGLAVINGVSGAVVGFLLLVIGLIGPEAHSSATLTPALQPFFTYFANVLTFPASEALAIGLFAFVIAIVDIITGVLMIKQSRLAGIVSIAVAIVGGLLINSYLIILALAGAFTYIHIVLSTIKAILIGIGWDRLTER